MEEWENYKSELRGKLSTLEFVLQDECNSTSRFRFIKDNARTIVIQLVGSEPIYERKYGSNNGNLIESIGLFKFEFDPVMRESDFVTFAFQNSLKHQIEFIIVPTEELRQRLTNESRARNGNNKYKIVFWLMPDGFIYNCTDISIEGECYFMSKGVNGRMADGTEWDFTEFLNEWNRLKRI